MIRGGDPAFVRLGSTDDPADYEITAYWNHHREGIEGAQAYEAAGVHRLLINLQAIRMGPPLEAIERFGREVLGHL